MIAAFRRLVRGESNIDFIGRSRLWATITGVVLLVSVLSLAFRRLDLSLEFEGGTSFTVPVTDTSLGVPELETVVDGFEVGDAKVQIQGSGTDRRALVRTKHLERGTQERLQAALAERVGVTPDDISLQDVGPTWGRQVSEKALRGLVIFLILVSLYISFRFEWKMATGALGALFHDLLATAGVYALVGFEVSPATVIALLTLMGFSLYDTVVVFDRVHENAGLVTSGGRITYSDMVNRSMNEVFIRSINTSLSSVLPVGGLLFVGVLLLGAETLKDLALAMFVGNLVSTYSSIFVAAPILAFLKEREPRNRTLRTKLAGEEHRVLSRVDALKESSAVGQAPRARAEAEGERGRPPLPVGMRPGTARPRRRKRGGRGRRR